MEMVIAANELGNIVHIYSRVFRPGFQLPSYFDWPKWLHPMSDTLCVHISKVLLKAFRLATLIGPMVASNE